MKYLLTEAERKAAHSSCYFEFQIGRHRGVHWLDDSLCLSDELFEETQLYELFSLSLDRFDCFGVTTVDKVQWDNLTANAVREERWAAVLAELTPWAERCFQTHSCFTICGI